MVAGEGSVFNLIVLSGGLRTRTNDVDTVVNVGLVFLLVADES